jgi:hypothetical protein
VDRPDAVTGPQVHAVVAVPADASDTFGAEAGRLADDVASLVGWWQGQDPTRVPRFDQALFGGVSCLDISFVRLSGSAATYANQGAGPTFNRVMSGLESNGVAAGYKKYLVYFDGPAVEDGVCGTGAGDFSSGPSYAVVWLAGCPDVATDAVAAHELLHSFGALPDGAPHACPAAHGGTGHPCDSPTDVLYPFAVPGVALSAQVLDFNHDDYYAHSGNWFDIQDSLWLHRLDLPQFGVSVSLTGGAGTVQSDLPGIECRAACTTQWDQGSTLTLMATPAHNDRFLRWSGACTGRADCSLAIDRARSVTAVFGPLHIPVRVSAAGRGIVACTPRCTRSFSAGDPLTLRAVAAKGWRFSRWTGACKGAQPVCRPKTDYALAARAVFKRR